MKVEWDRRRTPALTRESRRTENATATTSGRVPCAPPTITASYSNRRSYCWCFYITDNVLCLMVCLCAALEAWCSSVVEKTMFYRAARPLAARGWLRSLLPGATTDQSAKVGHRCSSDRSNTCMTDIWCNSSTALPLCVSMSAYQRLTPHTQTRNNQWLSAHSCHVFNNRQNLHHSQKVSFIRLMETTINSGN